MQRSGCRAAAALCLCTASLTAQPDTIHALWDSLLQQYVWAGRIAVTSLAADPRFEHYLALLATAHPEQWSRESQIAFWLNAYNACAVAILVRRPGLRYIARLDSLFHADTFCVAGMEHTLFTLRQQLRQFGDPLVHMGAGGLTESFPPLPRRAFTSANLRRQLRENARRFLQSPRGCLLDVESNVLWLSPIFAWYRADFERGGRSLLHWVAEYAEPTVAAYIAARRRELRVEFLDFDGRLTVRYTPPISPSVKPLETKAEQKRRRRQLP
jgi:hypothetical protein